MSREVLHDNIAKAIADAAGHGMREKCTRHADAVLDVLEGRQRNVPSELSMLYVAASKGFHVSESCGPEGKFLHVSKFRTLVDLQAFVEAWTIAMRSVPSAKAGAWCPSCKAYRLHHGDPDSIHLHLCNVCKEVVEDSNTGPLGEQPTAASMVGVEQLGEERKKFEDAYKERIGYFPERLDDGEYKTTSAWLGWRLWQAACQQPAAPRVVSDDDVAVADRIYWGDPDAKPTRHPRTHEQGLRAVLEHERAALESIAPAQQEPAAWINSDNLAELKRGGPRQPVFGKQHLDVDVPLYTSPQPAQPSVPVEAIREFIEARRTLAPESTVRLLDNLEQLIAAHDGKGNRNE